MCVTALCHARLGAPPTGPPSFGSCAICRAKEDGKTEPNSRSQVTSKKLRTVVKIYKEQVVWTTGVLFFCHNSWRLCKFANLWPFIFLRHLFLWFLSFGSLDRRTFTIHCEGASKEQSLDQFLKSNKASPQISGFLASISFHIFILPVLERTRAFLHVAALGSCRHQLLRSECLRHRSGSS